MRKYLLLQIGFFIILGFMSCMNHEQNELTSGFIEVDGGKIYYETKGQGETIVLLHPGLTDLRIWKDQVNEFSKNYKVVCYDQRGYGKSDLPLTNYSANNDLLTLLDSLKIEKSHLVGICMGALHAMEFAIEYPQRINTLAVSGMSFLNWEYSVSVIKKHVEFSTIVKDEGADKAIETIKTDLFWRQTIPSDNYKSAKEDFLNLLEENRKAFTANWQFKKQIFTTMDKISEINKPVLVIRPENEVDYMVEIGDYVVENIEKAEQIQIEGGGHLSNIEKPREFNKAILDFLDKYKN